MIDYITSMLKELGSVLSEPITQMFTAQVSSTHHAKKLMKKVMANIN